MRYILYTHTTAFSVIIQYMSDETKKLLDRALTLPDSERALLAASLIDSLEPDRDSDVEKQWELELSRRLLEIDAGAAKTIPWDEARRKILEGLG